MRNIIKLSICCAAAVMTLNSCEKFFDRVPENKFAAEMFFQNATDLQYYTNGLIDEALPAFDDIALGKDMYTDFCGTKASSDFLLPDRYNAGTASNWTYSTWSFLRGVAYMLENMENAKPNVSEDIYNHYEGVARFFRAFITFKRVKVFGDAYFIDHVVDPADSAILYGPRQDREYVVHRVLEDLKFACENCLADGPAVRTSGAIYINKYTAEALASRIALFEGTYRKYHSTNPSTGKPWTGEFESPEEILQFAFDAAKDVVENSPFTLHQNYRELFTSKTLPSDEVIWGRNCNEDLGIAHLVTYKYCSTTSSKLYGPTKDYVRMFLGSDGKPLPSGEISVTQEFLNRDKRLTACVLGPGQKKTDAKGETVDFAPDFTWTTTGYIWVKWVMPEYSPMNEGGTKKSLNGMPVLRLGEVMLNYAEAAEELGKLDASIWNKTVAELRKVHGGITYAPFPTVKDEWLNDYYTQDVLHPKSLSAAALEIRRERAVEMTFEMDSRYDDLMRWNLGDILERRYNHKGWNGIYVSKDEYNNGFTFNGKKYTVSKTRSTSETNYKISTSSDGAWTLSAGDHGYLIYNYKLQWDDKKYLYPIPTTALNVNPNLGQNDGWQWL